MFVYCRYLVELGLRHLGLPVPNFGPGQIERIVEAAPNAEVVSIVGGNPWRGTRRIVSVPEIDIVAVVDGRHDCDCSLLPVTLHLVVLEHCLKRPSHTEW